MRARLFGACAILVLATACTGGPTSIQVTSPSAAKCEVSVQNAITGMAPAGGVSSTLAVSTTRDCTWTAASTASWIAITSSTTGQGSGEVTYRISANPDPSQRRGTLDVNNFAITLIQDAAPCRYSVTPANTTVSENGGPVTLTVETLTGCAWTAVSQVSWIVVSAGASGTRTGPVTLTVAPNTSDARTGSVKIADQSVTIVQAERPAPPPTPPAPPTPAPTPPAPPAPDPPPPPTPEPPPPTPCVFAIASAGQNVGADAFDGTVPVTTTVGCAWTATSTVPWVTILTGAAGTGNGSVAYRVAANAGAARTGTLTIAGRTFTITQAAAPPPPPPPPPPCAFSIAPTADSPAAAGGNGSVTVTVTSGANCTWTAASNVPWITITSGASGTGNGTVAYTVAANTGAARTGTATIAGQTLTVTQAAAPPPPCTFTLSSPSHNATDAGGNGSVNVATSASCAWTATSGATWVTITSGASGTGNGTVAFSVAANTGAARNTTLTIGGQTFTIHQAAAPPPPPPPPPPACTFTILPTSQAMTAAGGPGSVSVTANGSDCSWTATSAVEWMTITNGNSHNGGGNVTFTVAANTGAARTGTLTIAGQTFTLNQAAP